jgi:hypothetical protein
VERAPVGGAIGHDDGFQGGPRERGAPRSRRRRRLADRVADAHALEAAQAGDLARPDRRALLGAAPVEDADGGDLGLVVAGEPQALARAQRAREHAHVGELLAARPAFHLEHGARGRAVDVAVGGGQQGADPGRQRLDARAGDGRAEVDGMHSCPPGLGGERAPQVLVGDGRLAVDVGGEERIVVVDENLRQARREARIAVGVGDEAGAAGPETGCRAHGHDGRRELLGDRVEDALAVRAGAVDLVDEEQRRDAQALQRAHEHACLRLDALDGRDDEHGAVEDLEHPLHLGDEVRVAGRVDEVDRDVVDRERDDRGPDRDAAPSLER